MSNLLAIDWDYFFPNPMEGHFNPGDGSLGLYDWSHREAPFFIDMVWSTRASGFLAADLPLPKVTSEWRTFAQRFNLTDDAVVYISDSNTHAGMIEGPDGFGFDNVWLYDAHHDAGYGVASYSDWLDQHSTPKGLRFSCEDWMLVHLAQGADLHWRFPTWHENFKKRIAERECTASECEHGHVAHGAFWPDGVDLDAAVDDMLPLDVEFDTVHVCRSGAWVPPWEDKKFLEFVHTFNRDVEQVDDSELDRRFDVVRARVDADALRRLREGIQVV